MFLRESISRRADGSTVSYLQLVKSVWDPNRKRSVHQVVHSFGRKDRLDPEVLRRLVGSLSRHLPEHAAARGRADGREILGSAPFGVAHLLESLWQQLGLDTFFSRALRRRRLLPRYERALLGMVLNRAVEPRSKLGTFAWLRSSAVHFPSAAELELQDFYRALDVLLALKDALENRLLHQALDLFGRTVDLVFYDTTSTYFEVDSPDEFRRRGKSKDHRPDLPQVVVGVAVNRDALPLRHWVHRGNTADMSTVEQAVKDLVGLGLTRVVFVGDRAMGGEKNLAALEQLGIPYLIGMKLRQSKVVEKVLSRKGGYRRVLENLEVKEVQLDGRRYVVCFNAEAAVRDREVRERMVLQLEQDLAKPSTARKALGHRIKKRYLHNTQDGRIEIDREKLRQEERLDGRSVILVRDSTLSAEEAALGYRGRWRVEAAIRHLKSFVDLRPVHHRTPERIRAHVAVCMLTYFLERLAELRSGETFGRIRDELQQVAAVTWRDENGLVIQTTSPSPRARKILSDVGVEAPKKILEVHPAAAKVPASP